MKHFPVPAAARDVWLPEDSRRRAAAGEEEEHKAGGCPLPMVLSYFSVQTVCRAVSKAAHI